MRKNLELELENGDDSLSVRRFSVHEEMSQTFSVSVWAGSHNGDLDLEPIVQRWGALKINTGRTGPTGGVRRYHGVVASMEMVQHEADGLTLYYVRIVPRLWLMSKRTNMRVFQHETAPDMVTRLLDEWEIEHEWQLSEQHPRLEIRTQYGETDLDFASRLLEEAGISYRFDASPESDSKLLLSDAPQSRAPRATPIPFMDQPNEEADADYVTALRLGQQVKPAGAVFHDQDFRRSPTFQLATRASTAAPPGKLLEIFRFDPGAFIVEKAIDAMASAASGGKKGGGAEGQGNERPDDGPSVGKLVRDHLGKAVLHRQDQQNKPEKDGQTPKKTGIAALVGEIAGAIAAKLGGAARPATPSGGGGGGGGVGIAGDDKGSARFSAGQGEALANKHLESLRADRRAVSFETNAIDLAPGTVFALLHSRPDLAPDKTLLLTEMSMEGDHDQAWSMAGRAVFADQSYRPPKLLDKPRVQGMQSAVVVGPDGEEIYTDELGRVRVQFHWDREGKLDTDSYCWARVAQAWGGAGYGMVNVPRVGHEVLVSFLEGDPDQPLVVGRLHNGAAPPPYPLPAHKTRTVWRSDSSPGSGGFNEIMMEDMKGSELLFVRAEKDHVKLVQNDEVETTGNDRTVAVSRNRTTRVGSTDEATIGEKFRVEMVPQNGGGHGTSIEMTDQRIVLSTGEASLTLEGPNIYLMAKGNIRIKSRDDDVEIEGGPWVKINCGADGDVDADTYSLHKVTGTMRDQDGEPLAGKNVLVKASDGTTQVVRTDDQGVYYALVPEGPSEVTLADGGRFGTAGPDLDDMNPDAETVPDGGPAA